MVGVRAASIQGTDSDGQAFVTWSVQVELDVGEATPLIERLDEEDARFIAACVAKRYAVADASPHGPNRGTRDFQMDPD